MPPRYREHGLAGRLRTLARTFADLVHAYRELPNMTQLADGSTWVRVSDGYGPPIVRMRLPQENEMLDAPQGREARSVAAMELMDEDVHGFMLFMLKREEDGNAAVSFRLQSKFQWMPAFTCALGQVVERVEGMKQA